MLRLFFSWYKTRTPDLMSNNEDKRSFSFLVGRKKFSVTGLLSWVYRGKPNGFMVRRILQNFYIVEGIKCGRNGTKKPFTTDLNRSRNT
jgi:hypothetical protein